MLTRSTLSATTAPKQALRCWRRWYGVPLVHENVCPHDAPVSTAFPASSRPTAAGSSPDFLVFNAASRVSIRGVQESVSVTRPAIRSTPPSTGQPGLQAAPDVVVVTVRRHFVEQYCWPWWVRTNSLPHSLQTCRTLAFMANAPGWGVARLRSATMAPTRTAAGVAGRAGREMALARVRHDVEQYTGVRRIDAALFYHRSDRLVRSHPPTPICGRPRDPARAAVVNPTLSTWYCKLTRILAF